MTDRIKKPIKITKKNPSQVLECIIKKHIDSYKSLYDILEIETTSNLKLKNAIIKCYINYIKTTKQIRKLYDYQVKYIDNAINELLINGKCIIKSPTGSGKTLICFNIIANIYKILAENDSKDENDSKEIKHFNVIFLTPRLKLCAQSIFTNTKEMCNEMSNDEISNDEEINSANSKNNTESDSQYISNTELLSINGVIVKYLEYNSKVAKQTQEELLKNSSFNFISSTYQSLDNLVDFIEKHKIPIDLIVYDEFHYIYNWKSGTKSSKKFIDNKLFAKKLFLSATPYKNQEENIELYGKLLNFVSVKELIEAGHLCTLEPMIEIDLDDYCDNKDDDKNYHNKTNSMTKYKKLPKMLNEGFTKYNKHKAIIFCNTTKNCYDLYEILNNELNDGKEDSNDRYIKIFQPYVGIFKNKLAKKLIKKADDTDDTDDNENTKEADELMEIETNITDDNIKTINKILEEYEKYTKPCILITCKKIDLGYDHKPIDFVIIADNKQSYIDLTQSVGRGIRKYKHDKICHVLLPIKLKDIREGNFKSAINYLEYIKNNVQYDIVSKIIKPNIDKSRISKLLELVKNLNIPIDENKISYEYLNNLLLSYKDSIQKKIYSYTEESKTGQKDIESIEQQDLDIKDIKEINAIDEIMVKIEKDNKILRSTWIQIYEELAIRNSSNIHQNAYDIKKLKYTLLQDKIKCLNFKNKIEYKSWALENEEISDPENEFKGTIWTNYYDFLNINTNLFPKTSSDWETICKKEKIFDYKTYCKYFKDKNLPEMPEEIYGIKVFGNLHSRLQKLKTTLINDDSDDSDDSDNSDIEYFDK